ncbi:MAG: hypothetical protein M3Z26_11925 [Bacteroidota bacterium]|nr:hypothetical protein [Bacteroidota bacterium]
MEQEIIETVLKEILDEIKTIHQEAVSKDQQIEVISKKIESFDGKLSSIKIEIPEIDLSPIQHQLESRLKRMEKLIEDQPKNITHKKQILLFPEYEAMEYYKVFFGRLLFWILLVLVATYLFSLGKQFIDNWKEVKQQEYIMQPQKNEKPDTLKKNIRKQKKLLP